MHECLSSHPTIPSIAIPWKFECQLNYFSDCALYVTVQLNRDFTRVGIRLDIWVHVHVSVRFDTHRASQCGINCLFYQRDRAHRCLFKWRTVRTRSVTHENEMKYDEIWGLCWPRYCKSRQVHYVTVMYVTVAVLVRIRSCLITVFATCSRVCFV